MRAITEQPPAPDRSATDPPLVWRWRCVGLRWNGLRGKTGAGATTIPMPYQCHTNAMPPTRLAPQRNAPQYPDIYPAVAAPPISGQLPSRRPMFT